MTPKNRPSESGQILILLALGIVALLGFTALAIDGGAIFFDRRSAQNAADAAALAGAYELAHDPWDTNTLTTRVETAAADRAHDNRYGTADGKTVTVLYPPDAASIQFATVDGVLDTDVNNYIQVKITSTVNTSLMHFIFPGTVQNTVEAVTHVVKPTRGNPFSGSGLVSLAPHACGRLYVGGNINANLIGGGIFVNSDNANCAADGGSESFFLYTPTMNVVGGIRLEIERQLGSDRQSWPGPVAQPAGCHRLPAQFTRHPGCADLLHHCPQKRHKKYRWHHLRYLGTGQYERFSQRQYLFPIGHLLHHD